jgi:hypothetical protein
MSSRHSGATAVTVLVGLAALAAYYWFGWTPRARFKSEHLDLITVLSTGRSGGRLLTVGFNNRSQGEVQVLKSAALRGPFSVLLVSETTRSEVPRRSADPQGHVGQQALIPPRKKLSWSVRLAELFGKLEPGGYRLRVIYDTQTALERGEPWVEGLDIGRVESQVVRFTVADP